MNARQPRTNKNRVKAPFGAPLPCAFLVCAFLVCAVFVCAPLPSPASTYSSTDAPGGNGLRPPDTPMKGRSMPAIGAFTDAYGNPVTPDEKEEVRKERLPGGAQGAQKQKERPLPNPADDAPVW